MEGLHVSVLLNELVSSFKIEKNKRNIIVDCTLGLAGHAKKIIEKMNPKDVFIGFDADIRNLELAKKNLEDVNNDVEKIFINSNFVNLKEQLNAIGIIEITGIYYDLGISSLHVDEAERGFSFKLDGPLDMRFDAASGLPASHIVNTYKEDSLVKIFKEYGEEPTSKKIAQKIIEKRKSGFRFKTTKELATLIDENAGFHKAKNRIFQALRIETNKEMENLENSLNDAIKLLKSGGTIFVISFHSIEDRIVKDKLKKESRDCICTDLICTCNHSKQIKIITKKPITPSAEEIKNNQRSRSAKARIAEKI